MFKWPPYYYYGTPQNLRTSQNCVRKCGVKFKESQGSHNKQLQPKKCGTKWKLLEKMSNGKPNKTELCFLLGTESTFHWGAVTKLLKISKQSNARNIGNISYGRNFLENLKRKYDHNALTLLMPIIVNTVSTRVLLQFFFPQFALCLTCFF